MRPRCTIVRNADTDVRKYAAASAVVNQRCPLSRDVSFIVITECHVEAVRLLDERIKALT
jgi:hypothetical protein